VNPNIPENSGDPSSSQFKERNYTQGESLTQTLDGWDQPGHHRREPTILEKSRQTLEDQRKKLRIIPYFDVYCPDIKDEEIEARKSKHLATYDKKFNQFKDVFMRANRKTAEPEIEEGTLKSMFDEARNRNLVSRPIPMKKDKTRNAKQQSDKEIILHLVSDGLEDSKKVTDFLSKITNLRYSEISEICKLQ